MRACVPQLQQSNGRYDVTEQLPPNRKVRPLGQRQEVQVLLAGQRSPRNSLLMDGLKDYGYVDSRGMDMRRKVIPLMKSNNGVLPVFTATDDYLKTVLCKKKVD